MDSKKIAIIAGVSVAIIIVFLFFISLEFFSNVPEKNHVPQAVIIDQLYSDVPSDYFHTIASNNLKKLGYTVDIYTTENATVDLFRNLPTMNYDFIVFRGHALHASEEDDAVMIFTGEKYTEEKYVQEQLFGQIKKGTPLLERTFSIDEKNNTGWVYVNGSKNIKMITSHVQVSDQSREEFFLFSPKSVNDLMKGKFHDSIILLGGCSTLKNDSMAKALVKRGASKVVGWTDLVSSSDNDRALLQILQKMADEKLSVTNATNKVKETPINNPKYDAKLEIFG
jgi:hypothetical protein